MHNIFIKYMYTHIYIYTYTYIYTYIYTRVYEGKLQSHVNRLAIPKSHVRLKKSHVRLYLMITLLSRALSRI